MSVSHSVVVNGVPFEVFEPNRGLRQGDPIFPHLFIICVEVFSHILQMEVNRSSLQGIRVCRNAPKVSHLLFADNNISFCRTEDRVVNAIRQVLSLIVIVVTSVKIKKGCAKKNM